MERSPSLALVEAWAPPRQAFVLRPVDVLRVSIALLVVANLGRIPVFSTGERSAPLLVNDLAVAAFVVVGAFAMLARRTFRLDTAGIAALTFAAVGAASALYSISRFGLSPFELAVSFAYLARWLLYYAIYLVMVNVVRGRDVARVWSALETTMLAIAGFGIVQAAFLPGFAQMVYPDSRLYLDWDPQGHRLVSTVLEPNIVGAMLMIVLLVQLAQLSVGARVPRWRPLVVFVALVLTLSRSSVVGLLAGLGIIVLVYGIPKRLVRAAVVVGIALVAVLPKLIAFAASYGKFSLTGSAAARLAAWALGLKVFVDHWVVGVGFNTYGFVIERYGVPRLGVANYSTDGGLLFAAAMTGVVGVAFLLLSFWLVIRRCAWIWRRRTFDPMERGIAIGTAASIVALCVHSVFANSLFTTFVMELLWILFGLVFAIAHDATPRVPTEGA